MIQLGPQEIAILTWLVGHDRATAQEIGHACEIASISVRGRLVALEKHHLVTGTPNKGVPPARVYAITPEGRQKVEG